MIIIENLTEKYFKLNGLTFAKIYQPLAQGSESIAIYQIYNAYHSLRTSERFDQYQIDGVVYSTMDETMRAILDATYSQTVSGELISMIESKLDKGDYSGNASDLYSLFTENQTTGFHVVKNRVDLPVSGSDNVGYFVLDDETNASDNGAWGWDGSAYYQAAKTVVSIIDESDIDDAVSGKAVADYSSKFKVYFPEGYNFEVSNALNYVSRSSEVRSNVLVNQGSVENKYSEYAFSKGVPNVVRCFSESAPSHVDFPKVAFYVSPQSLQDAGIVPSDSNPPIVNLRAGFLKETLQNATVQTVYFCLRYGGNIQADWDSNNDVMTFNNANSFYWNAGGDEDYWNGVGESWSHEIEVSETSKHKVYAHKGVPVRATYEGQDLTGIFIVYRAGSSGVCSYETFLPSVTLQGSEWDIENPYINEEYRQIEPFVLESDLSQELRDKVNNVSSGGEVNVKNSSRILIVGDSFTSGGARDFKDKGWISMFSSLSPFVCEGFSRSGDNMIDAANALISNDKRYHPIIGVRDVNVDFALLCFAENEGVSYVSNPAEYLRKNIERLCDVVESMGAIPILVSQFGNKANSLYYSIISDVAYKRGYLFLDVASSGYVFNQNRYLPFWNNGHPGVRTNSLLWYSIHKGLENYGVVNKGLKIYRNRSSFSFSSDQELLFRNKYDIQKKFKEISIGHRRSTDATVNYYDSLDLGVIASQAENSEYLKLVNNENISFQNKALLRFTIPSKIGMVNSVKLVMSDKTLNAKVRNYIDSDLTISSGNNIGFRYTGDPQIVVGDTYSSNEAANSGIVFTVTGKTNGFVYCSFSSQPVIAGSVNGELTRLSGTGDSSVNYTNTVYSYSADYFNKIAIPNGKWEDLTANSEGDFEISNLIGRLNYDTIDFLVDNGGSSFELNDIKLEWDGVAVQKYSRFEKSNKNQSSELLNQNFVGDSQINDWTNEDNRVPFIPFDNSLPVGVSKIVEIEEGQSISQTVSLQTTEPTRFLVEVWARRLPSKFNHSDTFSLNDDSGNNEIFQDSYDLAEISIVLNNGNEKYNFDEIVPLHWVKIQREFSLTSPVNRGVGFELKSLSKNVQIAFASLKK